MNIKMLEGLDRINWSALDHAYGVAGDVPALLRGLVSPETDGHEEIGAVYSSICHQGTVYSATAAAIPFLYEILVAPGVPNPSFIAHLISSVAVGQGYLQVHAREGRGEASWREILAKKGKALEEELEREAREVKACREACSKGLLLLLPFLFDPEAEIRNNVSAALGYFPEHSSYTLPALREALLREQDEQARETMSVSLKRLEDDPGRRHSIPAD